MMTSCMVDSTHDGVQSGDKTTWNGPHFLGFTWLKKQVRMRHRGDREAKNEDYSEAPRVSEKHEVTGSCPVPGTLSFGTRARFVSRDTALRFFIWGYFWG